MKAYRQYAPLFLLFLWQGIAIGQTEAKPKKVLGFNAQVQQTKTIETVDIKALAEQIKALSRQLASNETKRLRHIVNKEDKVTLQLLGVYGKQDQLYLKFELFNDGTVPYYIKGWDCNVVQKTKDTSASKTPLLPLYEYNRKDHILPANSSLTKVLVLEKVTLQKDEYLTVQLLEKVISRTPTVRIASKYINLPFPLVIPAQ